MNTKKTKIVATLGPKTKDRATLKKMMIAGVNVFRINFSHAKYEQAKEWVNNIRSLNEELGFHVACLADLQGPKLRIGKIKENIVLEKGATFIFTNTPLVGDEKKAFMTYQNFANDVKIGEHILVDDGKLELKVKKISGTEVITEVVRGGKLSSNKGVNLPNTDISLPALTKKDIEDAKFALSLEVDWMAISFVRHAKDLEDIHDLIAKNSDIKKYRTPVISKIEKPEAVKNIHAIIAKSDGIMVARGDLGVEIPFQEVPLIQKKLIKKAKEASIPIIVATQMMESMIHSQVPTRAEVSDVANAIIDGTDAVMLSGETAAGNHPVKVIESMRKIIHSVEHTKLINIARNIPEIKNTDRDITNMICFQAIWATEQVKAKAITSLTQTGYTVALISSWRPAAQILLFSANQRLLQTFNLFWGVKGKYYVPADRTSQRNRDVNEIAKKYRFVEQGNLVVNLNATPAEKQGITNTLRISKIT